MNVLFIFLGFIIGFIFAFVISSCLTASKRADNLQKQAEDYNASLKEEESGS